MYVKNPHGISIYTDTQRYVKLHYMLLLQSTQKLAWEFWHRIIHVNNLRGNFIYTDTQKSHRHTDVISYLFESDFYDFQQGRVLVKMFFAGGRTVWVVGR